MDSLTIRVRNLCDKALAQSIRNFKKSTVDLLLNCIEENCNVDSTKAEQIRNKLH